MAAFHNPNGETEALLLKAAAVQPPSYRARIALAQFYLDASLLDSSLLDSSRGNANSAEAQAKQAVQLSPGRIEAYAVLAQVYARRGAWNELESTLADAVHEVPDDMVPYCRAAERLIAGGHDPERAEHYLRIYLGQAPEGNEPTAADAQRLIGRIHRSFSEL